MESRRFPASTRSYTPARVIPRARRWHKEDWARQLLDRIRKFPGGRNSGWSKSSETKEKNCRWCDVRDESAEGVVCYERARAASIR